MRHHFWNLLCTIKNGQKAKKLFVTFPKTQISINSLNLLWNENFISGYQVSINNCNNVDIFLRYYKKTSVITSIKYISKPGNRLYYSLKQLCKVDSNVGLLMIRTNKGILSLSECKKANIGGEVLALIN